MAVKKNYLDKTGLALVWEKIKNMLSGKVDKVDGKGLSTNDYTSDEKTKLANVAAGAQVNVLEGIQKNGTNVTVTNKIANITVPTATSDLTNDSGFITTSDIPEGAAASTTVPKADGTANPGTELAFARGDHVHPTDTSRASLTDLIALDGRVGDLETAVGTGGSVDSKISTAIQDLDSSITATSNQAISSVTITDGKITGSTKITVPTNTNQLTNGAGFQTASDVSTAIADALDDITGITYSVVEALPATGEAGIIYLIAHTHGERDVYDEYIWVNNAFEKIGNTDIDLSGYMLTTDMVAITDTEINTICV